MSEEKNTKDKEVLFNLGMQQLQLIGDLLRQASNYYLNNRPYQRYKALNQVELCIVANLSKEEREELTEIKKPIRYIISKQKHEDTYEADDFNQMMESKSSFYIDKFEVRLKELLEKKQYLIPMRQEKGSAFGQDYEED